MTTREIRTAIRRHHARMNDMWVVLFEPWGIDALALSQSHGKGRIPHRRISYEIKTSRPDFRRELDAWPKKADRALDMAHAYMFVTPTGLLSDTERARRAPEMTEPMGGAGLRQVLSTRGKREALYVPPPAGLMEVGDDLVCRVRVRPTYGPSPRAWTDKEVAYLAMYAHRPNIIATAENSNWEARNKLAELTRTLENAQQWHERARQALEGYAPLLVQVGQRWRVPGGYAPPVLMFGPGAGRRNIYGEWYGAAHLPPAYDKGPVDCEVVEILPERFGEAGARLRRLDTGHTSDRRWGMALSELLMQAERIDREQAADVVPLRR